LARAVVWTRRARSDLHLAVAHIAADSPAAARTFASAVVEAGRSLARLSERGRVVPELSDPAVRELILGKYRIIYEVLPERERREVKTFSP
jgi:plasmid stabilization system protein ParE